MKGVIREKQSRDEEVLNRLENEVDLLKIDLERVHKVATTDPLTGANNRYSFDSISAQLCGTECDCVEAFQLAAL